MAVQKPEGAIQRKKELENQELLTTLQGLLEFPMVILSLIMLVLFIIEVSVKLPPSWSRVIALAEWLIWVAFIIEFIVKLAIAPDKANYLSQNWLLVLSIILPALRIFRIFRATQAIRSIGTLRVITLGNRSISKLRILFQKRKLQYVIGVVIAVALLSGAGIYFLEQGAKNANIKNFGDALWWAAGIITTVGTEKYPVTPEGRVLAVFLMWFGVGIFGYVAGALASLFVGIDTSDQLEEQSITNCTDDSKINELMNQITDLESRISLLTNTLTPHRKDINSK